MGSSPGKPSESEGGVEGGSLNFLLFPQGLVYPSMVTLVSLGFLGSPSLYPSLPTHIQRSAALSHLAKRNVRVTAFLIVPQFRVPVLQSPVKGLLFFLGLYKFSFHLWLYYSHI